MLIKITDNKLARRRHHNSMAICAWVQKGYIPPRKESVLSSILFSLRQGVK